MIAAIARLRGPDREWAGPSAFGMFAMGALALVAITMLAPTVANTKKVARLASIALADDDGGRALFANQELVPDRPVSRCLKVNYAGGSSSTSVRLAATDVAGSLASSLRLVVSMGTGGGNSSCSGFNGGVVYTGTLAGLGSGVDTGWTPAGPGDRTYQITVSLPGGVAQGADATGTFQWLLTPDVLPDDPTPAVTAPVEAPPAPIVVPETALVPEIGDAVARALTGGPTKKRNVVSRVAAKTWEGITALAAELSPEKLRETVETLVNGSVEAGNKMVKKHNGLPAASVVALGSFLVLQGRIDRKDPKLALAPLWAEEDLSFEEPEADPSGAANPQDGVDEH